MRRCGHLSRGGSVPKALCVEASMPVGGSFIGDAQQLRAGSPEPLASLTNDQHQQAASHLPGPAPATTGGHRAWPLGPARGGIISVRDQQTAAWRRLLAAVRSTGCQREDGPEGLSSPTQRRSAPRVRECDQGTGLADRPDCREPADGRAHQDKPGPANLWFRRAGARRREHRCRPKPPPTPTATVPGLSRRGRDAATAQHKRLSHRSPTNSPSANRLRLRRVPGERVPVRWRSASRGSRTPGNQRTNSCHRD